MLTLSRPKQWYKNFLIFVPLVFSLHLFNIHSLSLSLLGFVILCLSSGGSYAINDLVDYERDLKHPIKNQRPLAKGLISKPKAVVFALSLISVSILLSLFLGYMFLIINCMLIASMILYSLYVKHIFMLDVFAISVNYVLRAVAGALALNLKISPWLIMGVFFLALLLALGKRKNEILFLKESANDHRKILSEYDNEILNYAIATTSATIILAYSLYSMTGPVGIDDWRLIFTIPIAFFILLTYVNQTFTGKYKGRELNDLITSNKTLIISSIVFVVSIVILLYFVPSGYLK